ncbi:MAG: GAF domain-containing protein, partial [Cellulomonadaceae bacterium]
LWVDGDRDLRRRAEAMSFVEGADWSERAVGTSAPGTAVAVGHAVQIHREEHFHRIVHPWSCSAVPVRDRVRGLLIGVIDITGGDDAVAPATLPLLEATVAAVEAELQLRHLQSGAAGEPARPATDPSAESAAVESRAADPPGGALPRPVIHLSTRPARPPSDTVPFAELSVLGRTEGLLTEGGRRLALTPRHAEILTLLAWHREGLSAPDLALAVYGEAGTLVTLRAEMVRLRKALTAVAPDLVPASRPYRLRGRVDLDAHRVLAFLDRGAHRVALAAYPGPVLPGSEAPGIVAMRDQIRRRAREAMLADAGVDTLLRYARTEDAVHDVEVWQACLRRLPPRSPRRAGVVSHLEWIDAQLA